MNLKFSGKGLAFLSHYMAKIDIRYYLCGVYLRPLPAEAGGGVLGAATNGHILGMWHDPDGQVDRPAILRVSDHLAKACGKRVRGVVDDPMLVLRDNRLACVAGETEVYIQPNQPQPKGGKLKATEGIEPWEIFAKFPDIGRVVPNLSEANHGPENHINAAYLSLIAKSLPKSDKWGGGIKLRQAYKDGSILALCPMHPQAAVVVMPLRDDGDKAPGWLNRFTSHEQRIKEASAAPLPVHEPSDAGPPDGDGRGWSLVKGGEA